MTHKRQEAPGRLELVREFVNTADLEGGDEEFASPAGLARWLQAHDLLEPDAEVGEKDLERAIAAREALRAQLKAHNGSDRDPEAVATLHEAANRAGIGLSFDEAGASRLEPRTPGADGAIGRLLTIVHEADRQGEWIRMKVCPADDCQWAFYDRSRNRSATWCDMKVCGNRAKVREYRERRLRGPSR